MEEYITFISDNYIVFLIILLVIIFSVIGYLSDKKGFLKKKDKINNFNSEKNDSVKLKDEAVSTLKSNLDNPTNETQEQLIEPELTNNQEEKLESQEKVEPSTVEQGLDGSTNETQEQLVKPELTNNQEENIETQEKVEPSTEEQGLDESTNETREQLVEPELINNQERSFCKHHTFAVRQYQYCFRRKRYHNHKRKPYQHVTCRLSDKDRGRP